MAEGDHERIELVEEIRRLSIAVPFVPFDIIVTSGDRAEVTQPGMVATVQSQIHVAKVKSNAFDIIRANQISAVRVHDVASN